MLTYPNIDPIAVSLGPLKVHWYGLMYLVGFACAWWVGRARARRPGSDWQEREVDDLIFYGMMGLLLGARIGYVIFYNLPPLIEDPLTLFRVWEGGMSFHGGLLGVLIAMWLFGRSRGKGFFRVTDFLVPLAPLGLCAGRIGNFINGELWGGPSDLPWAMRVPCLRVPELCERVGADPASVYSVPVHPSQLYEACLEGLVLFTILWLFTSRPRPTMAASGVFLLCYGAFRVCVELVRMPDIQLGYLAFGWVTMGQLLSLPMILFGLGLLGFAYLRTGKGG